MKFRNLIKALLLSLVLEAPAFAIISYGSFFKDVMPYDISGVSNYQLSELTELSITFKNKFLDDVKANSDASEAYLGNESEYQVKRANFRNPMNTDYSTWCYALISRPQSSDSSPQIVALFAQRDADSTTGVFVWLKNPLLASFFE